MFNILSLSSHFLAAVQREINVDTWGNCSCDLLHDAVSHVCRSFNECLIFINICKRLTHLWVCLIKSRVHGLVSSPDSPCDNPPWQHVCCRFRKRHVVEVLLHYQTPLSFSALGCLSHCLASTNATHTANAPHKLSLQHRRICHFTSIPLARSQTHASGWLPGASQCQGGKVSAKGWSRFSVQGRPSQKFSFTILKWFIYGAQAVFHFPPWPGVSTCCSCASFNT